MSQTYINRVPKGLHLVQNPDGTANIVGVPDDEPGYYKFTVRCEDSDGKVTEREFEIAIGDVISLNHFDGTDGDTAIIDETGKTWTREGSVAELSNTVKKFGSTSLSLGTIADKTGFKTTHHADFNIDDPIVVTGWVYPTQALTTGQYSTIFRKGDDNTYTNGFLTDYFNNNGTTENGIRSHVGNSNSNELFTIEPTVNEWNYVHVEYHKDKMVVQVNDQSFEKSISVAPTHNTGTLNIGFDPQQAVRNWQGYLDELKIVKGVGYIKEGFLPPTKASDYPKPNLILAVNGIVPRQASNTSINSLEDIEIIGVNAPYTVEITDGTLPGDWIATVNGNYVEITGSGVEPGAYTFTVSVTDDEENTAKLPLTIKVHEYEWLLNEEIEDVYLAIKSGVGPYSNLQIDSGTMPPGLSYNISGNNVKISGTPNDDMDYDGCVFSLEDSNSDTVYVKIGWSVNRVWNPSDFVNTELVAWYVSDDPLNTKTSGVVSTLYDKTGRGNHAGKFGGTVEMHTGPNGRDVFGSVSNAGSYTFRSQNPDILESTKNVGAISLAAVHSNIVDSTAESAVLNIRTGQGEGNVGFSRTYLATGYSGTNIVEGGGRRLDSDSYTSIPSHVDVGKGWWFCTTTNDYSNAKGYISVNGVESNPITFQTIGNTSNTNSESLWIGANSTGMTSPTRGDTGELLVMIGTIEPTERKKLEGYFAYSWALQDNLQTNHPYKYDPPLVYPYIRLQSNTIRTEINQYLLRSIKISGGVGEYVSANIFSGYALPDGITMLLIDNQLEFSGAPTDLNAPGIYPIWIDITDVKGLVKTVEVVFEISESTENLLHLYLPWETVEGDQADLNLDVAWPKPAPPPLSP